MNSTSDMYDNNQEANKYENNLHFPLGAASSLFKGRAIVVGFELSNTEFWADKIISI
jgi:hypothetical protein